MSNTPLSNDIIDKRIIGRTIKRIGNYEKNNKTKIEWKCLIDGNKWFATPSEILNNKTGCPVCGGSIKQTNEIIDKKLIGRNIKRIGNYVNMHSKIEWKCLIDGCVWITSPCNVVGTNTTGCPKCKKVNANLHSLKLSNKIIDKKLIGRNIKRIGNYEKNNKTKIEWKCLIDGNKWFALTKDILNKNSGCPLCMFKNEKQIYNLLNKYIKYNYFKHHKTLQFNKRKYIVDFYIETNKNKYVIEYNGEQHYRPVRFCGISQYRANTNFKKQKRRDCRLRSYCKKNNLVLIEIPYHFTPKQRLSEIAKII